MNFFDAHDPYGAPDSTLALMSRFPRRAVPMVQALKAGELGPADPERVRSARDRLERYEAALRYLDGEVGRLLTSLAARGQLDNTIIIVTWDHGEEFGEHGLYWHAHSLYLPALHVPLVIAWPGRIPAGVRVAPEIALRDVAATVLDLVGQAPRGEPGRQTAAGADRSRAATPALPGHSRQHGASGRRAKGGA